MSLITISNTGGNWSDTAAWIGGIIPNSSDEILAIGTSGPLTIDTAAACRSLNLTNYTSTLTHAAGNILSIGDAVAGTGNVALQFTAGMTYVLGDDEDSPIHFVSTSVTQQTIDFNGKTTSDVKYDGLGASWIMSSIHNAALGSEVSLQQGTFNTNSFAMNWSFFYTDYSTTRTLTMGSSIITCTLGPNGRSGESNNDFFRHVSVTGLTVTANTAIVKSIKNALSVAPLFRGSAFNWNGMSLEFHGGGIATVRAGNFTMANLTVNGDLFNGVEDRLQTNESYTVTNSLTFNGAGPSKRLGIHSNSGTRTITVTGATVTAQYSNISSMNFTELKDLSGATGGTGDLGGNTNIIFTVAKSAFWYASGAGTYQWSDPTKWFLVTNGVSPINGLPLPQDTIVFDSNSVDTAGTVIQADVSGLGRDINWTGVTDNPEWHFLNSSTITGGLILDPNMTVTAVDTSRWFWMTGNGTGQTFDLDTQGVDLPFELFLLWMDDNTNSVDLQSSILLGKTLYIRETIFNAGANDLDIGSSYSRTNSVVNMGSGVWTIREDQNVFAAATWRPREGTVNSQTATLRFHNDGVGTQVMDGLGHTYHNVETAGTGNSTLLIQGSNTINKLSNTKTVSHTVQFVAGTTNTVSNLNLVGTAGNEITLEASTAATFTLTSPSGLMFNEYLILENSIGTGGAVWAALNSTDVGGNTGWLFNARTLYHKGNLVSDSANWSLTDGGAGGEPKPTAIDLAIFNTGVGVDPNFDELFHVGEMQYLTSKWANGVGAVTVENKITVSGGTSWSMTTDLTLRGDIEVNGSWGHSMPIFIEGNNTTIGGVSASGRWTSVLTTMNKNPGKKLTLLNNVLFKVGSDEDLIMDSGIIDMGIYDFTVADTITSNGGNIIGTVGVLQCQKLFGNAGGTIDPFQFVSNSGSNSTLFSDAAGFTLMPSGGSAEFTGSNHWSIDQNFTEFPILLLNKCPTCGQGGQWYAKDVHNLNLNKIGTGFISGDLYGSGLISPSGKQSFVDDAVQNVFGPMGFSDLTFDKTLGAVIFDSDVQLHKCHNDGDGSLIDFGTNQVHIKATGSHLPSIDWEVAGLDFYDLKYEIATSGGGSLNSTSVLNNFILQQTESLTGTLTLGGDLIIIDPTVTGTLVVNMNGTGIQLLDIVNGSNITATINMANSGGEVKLAHAILATGATGGYNVNSGVFNLDGYDLDIQNPLTVASGGTLKVKGDEIITIKSLASRGNADFNLNAGSTVQYFDGAVVALVDELADVFQNLTFGASKVHEFADGIGNEIEVAGVLDSDGTPGSLAILRTLADAALDWYLNLSGTSSLGNKVDVKRSNASSGLQVDAIGSADSGNTTNWFGLLTPTAFDWIGGISTDFEVSGNWQGGVVPGNTDVALYRALSSVNCDLSANIDVLGIDMDGYVEDLNQNSGFSIIVGASGLLQKSGVFNGGDSQITIKGNSLLSGGIFNSTTGLLKVEAADFNITTGVFNHNDGSFEKRQLNSTTTTLNGGFTFYDLEIRDTNAGSSNSHITIDTDLIVKNTYKSTTRASGGWWTYLDGGSIIHCEGDIDGNLIAPRGSTAINIDGAIGNQVVTNLAVYAGGTFVINKLAGTVIFSGELQTGFSGSNVFDFQTPVDFTTNSVFFDVNLSSGIDLTLMAGQPFVLYDLRAGGAGTGAGIFDLATNVITVKGDLTGTMDAGGGHDRKINNGGIDLEGNLNMVMPTTSSRTYGSAKIRMVGTVNATIKTDNLARYFNDIEILKTGGATVKTLDQYGGNSGVFKPTSGWDNDGGNGNIDVGTFLVEAGMSIEAHVNKITAGTYTQNDGTFNGSGVEHKFDAFTATLGTLSFGNLFVVRTVIRIEAAVNLTVTPGTTLRSDGGDTVAMTVDLNDHAIEGFSFAHGAFNLTFQTEFTVGGNLNLGGSGFMFSSFSGLTVKVRGDMTGYTRSYTTSNNIVLLFDEVYDQSIKFTGSSSINRALISLDIRNSSRTVTMTTTNGDGDIRLGRDFTCNIGESLIIEAGKRMRWVTSREFIVDSDKHFDKVFFNKGTWLPHITNDLHVNEFEFTPRNGSNPSISNNGTGSNIHIYKSYIRNGAQSTSAVLDVNRPEYHFVGPLDKTIEVTDAAFRVVEGLYFVDEGKVRQISNIVMQGGSGSNANDWRLNITNGAWDTNGFDLTVDGQLNVDDTLITRGNEIVANITNIDPTTSTVEFYDTNSFTVSSMATAFYNIILNQDKIHSFSSGIDHTVNGVISSKGTLANPALLRSTVPGFKWKLDLQGSSTVADTIDIEDCDARQGKWFEAVGSKYTGSNFRCIEPPVRSLMV